MSRGPGYIQSAIETLFEENPDKKFSLSELVVMLFGDASTKAQYASVSRAARKVAKVKRWSKWRGRYQRIKSAPLTLEGLQALGLRDRPSEPLKDG